MVEGALSIIRYHDQTTRRQLTSAVMHDYANYFYPYIKDQLSLNQIRFFPSLSQVREDGIL